MPDCELDRLRAEVALLFRQLSDQTRHNIESRRSLCAQSDRYKAELDQLRAKVTRVEAAVEEIETFAANIAGRTEIFQGAKNGMYEAADMVRDAFGGDNE